MLVHAKKIISRMKAELWYDYWWLDIYDYLLGPGLKFLTGAKFRIKLDWIMDDKGVEMH